MLENDRLKRQVQLGTESQSKYQKLKQKYKLLQEAHEKAEATIKENKMIIAEQKKSLKGLKKKNAQYKDKLKRDEDIVTSKENTRKVTVNG